MITPKYEYLKPLFRLLKLVYGVKELNSLSAHRKYLIYANLFHILTTHLKLSDIEAARQLKINLIRVYYLKDFFNANNQSEVLSNISYGIYQSYLQELKKLDLK